MTEHRDFAAQLLAWAEILDIPSGEFVNEDLREAASEITRLNALVAKLGKVMKEIAETADIGLNIGPVISKARAAAELVKGEA